MNQDQVLKRTTNTDLLTVVIKSTGSGHLHLRLWLLPLIVGWMDLCYWWCSWRWEYVAAVNLVSHVVAAWWRTTQITVFVYSEARTSWRRPCSCSWVPKSSLTSKISTYGTCETTYLPTPSIWTYLYEPGPGMLFFFDHSTGSKKFRQIRAYQTSFLLCT